jgi:hypothetical protein
MALAIAVLTTNPKVFAIVLRIIGVTYLKIANTRRVKRNKDKYFIN